MGHLDQDEETHTDEAEQTYTIKVYMPGSTTPQTFTGCTDYELDSEEETLKFTDSAGKDHVVKPAAYEVTEE